MLSATGTSWNVTGEPIRGNAYYGLSDGIVTIQVIYQNFVGGFGIQGTLSLDPRPEDWFWITLNPTGSTTSSYITFPQNILAPTGADGGDTGSQAFTMIGNFVFLRACVVRDYITPAPVNPNWDIWTYGAIDQVLLSL